MAKVLIADDHPLVRDGLRTVLAVSFDRCELFEADDLPQTVEVIDREGDFDLVLLDYNMPGMNGLEGLETLRNRYPYLPVVIVSASLERRLVYGALERGAAGFIPKSLPRSEIMQAVKSILAGEVFHPEDLEDAPVDAEEQEILKRIRTLTPQQLKVLQLVVAGRLNKEIAYLLDVTETTVKAHVSAVLQKLQVFSRTQAVILANKVSYPPPWEGTERVATRAAAQY
jgi:DNA-binding NarL/FixJ family response regulator